MSGQTPPLVAPRDDPRAAAAIRHAKSWCGLGGFVVAGLSTYLHGGLLLTAGERALVGGVAGYLIGWAVGLAVWRRILRAEAHHALELLRERAVGKSDAAAQAPTQPPAPTPLPAATETAES